MQEYKSVGQHCSQYSCNMCYNEVQCKTPQQCITQNNNAFFCIIMHRLKHSSLITPVVFYVFAMQQIYLRCSVKYYVNRKVCSIVFSLLCAELSMKYSVHYIVYTLTYAVQCAVYCVHSGVCSIVCSVQYSVQCAEYSIYYSLQCTVCRVYYVMKCAVYRTQ